MFFRIMDDGAGGYYGYWTTPGTEAFLDLATGPIMAIIFVIIPIVTVLYFGEFLLLPIVLILFGVLLLYTPQGNGIRQNALLFYTKAALSIPLFAYGATSFPYIIGRAAEGTVGFLVLITFIVGAGAMLLIAAYTHGLGTPLFFLWFASFFATTGDGFPTTTNFLLHMTYLEGIGIFIYGVVQTLKNKDKNGIYILPKLIAFGLGCIPLAASLFIADLPHWMVAAIILALYLGIYLTYNFILKQPSIFTDWLLYPFLVMVGCYSIVASYSEYIFPSDIIDELYDFLAPLKDIFTPSYKGCVAFAQIISDLLYGLMKIFFKIMPKIGIHAVHANIPAIVGFIAEIALIILMCNITAKIYKKRAQIKA